jgi:hypothetical protein
VHVNWWVEALHPQRRGERSEAILVLPQIGGHL